MTVEIHQLGRDVWEQRVFTTAPPTGVFDYIADFQKHVDWERELVTVKPLNRRTGAAGGAYLKTYGARPTGLVERIFARRQRVTCKVGTVERPERIVWRVIR